MTAMMYTFFQFGKGIYFADMCSKSANYCFASKLKSEGLVVLSEVRNDTSTIMTLE